jgi:hypothetical protein
MTASVVAAGVTLAAISLLPVPLYGTEGTIALYREWWTTVSGTTASTLTSPDNISFAGAYAKWLGPGTLATALALATGIAALGAAAAAFRRRGGLDFPEGLEGSLLLMLIPLLSPQGWDYVLLLATPAVIVLANGLDRLPPLLSAATIVASVAIGLTLFDVMGRAAYGRFMELAVVTVCAVIMLAGLFVLRHKHIA